MRDQLMTFLGPSVCVSSVRIKHQCIVRILWEKNNKSDTMWVIYEEVQRLDLYL